MWIRMRMYLLFLFLCLGFWIQETEAGNVMTVCRNEEEYNECGSCEGTCDNPKDNAPCQQPCYPGCFCKPGLLRARDRSCVEPKDCNRSLCRENEEYLDCGSQCPLTCKNYLEPIFCTKPCKQGCFCKPGYVIGPDKKCILPAECPIAPCGINEMTTDCLNPCNTCSQRGNCYYEYCNRGCDCKPGYFRNSTGQCVKEEHCDVQELKCPQNEHPVSCVSLCNDCWTRGECDPLFCQPGCDCLPGYFRDENANCVPEAQCNTEGGYCGVNEEYSDCVVPCNDCNSRGQCRYSCEAGCDCKNGYYKDETGVCIPADQCPEVSGIEPRRCYNCRPKCAVGEQYYRCQPGCKTTCESYYRNVTGCSTECRPGCYCKEGLVRNSKGACVNPQQCPQVCGENENYKECGSSCPPTCHDPNPTCTLQCISGCFCKKGFFRGPDGRCVRHCPLVCGVNEEFQKCGSPCPLTCGNLTAPKLCPNVCVQGCVCKPGFVRGPRGSCIPPSECPQVCQENEVFLECGSSCQGSCENLGKVSESCLLTCRRGCFCKPQYIRGPDGKCILPNQCPIVCRKNEVFQECGSPCQDTCENIGKAVSGVCSFACIKGCFCKPGYVRGPDGRCILPNHCPLVCPDNEVLLSCGSPCQRTCDNLNSDLPPCILPCIKGCFCKPGYVRGPNRLCILPTECPAVCGEYEEFQACGTACPATCQNATAPTACNLPCKKGCFCTAGYVRGPDGKCILPTACPVVCGEYEEFQACGTACPATCQIASATTACNLPCKKGCFCTAGYVRGPDGKCIPPTACPVVCGEYEEFQTCGPACPATCQNATAPRDCNLPCKKGCFCTPGYVRGPDGKCIPPTACRVVCGKNEQFYECKSPCQPTCENRDPKCNFPCLTGCFCKPGFVRDANGICIDIRSCPIGPCTKENEIFDTCGPACIRTCARIEFRLQCPKQCVKGCFCKDGFVRDIASNCIQPQQCPKEPQMCPPNESFYACKPTCRHTCETLDFQGACDDLCRPGCDCRGGLVRDDNNKCIPPRDCPGEILARKRGNKDEVVTTLSPEISITLPATKNPLPTINEETKTTSQIIPKVTTQVPLTTSGIIPTITTADVNKDETVRTNTPNPITSPVGNANKDKSSTDPSTAQQPVTTVKDQITTVKDQITTAKDQITTVKDKMTTVKDQITTVKDQITTVKDQITTLKDQITTVKDQITTVKAETVTSVTLTTKKV